MRAFAFFIIACLLAGTAPLLTPPQAAHRAVTGFPGWPRSFDGRPLVSRPLSQQEEELFRPFPGKAGKFTDGRAELFLRWVKEETRLLHPASHCFSGAGYTLRYLSIFIDTKGRHWGRFEARKGGEILLVSERLEDLHGGSWTDVSSWYWAAATGKSKGPWWAITKVTAARESAWFSPR